MADHSLQELMTRQKDRVQAVLNILIESPYFYATDDTQGDLFPFLLRYRREFEQFFKTYYDWDLVFDQLPRAKCARVFKSRWYNTAISEGKRHWFRFTKRDECLAFMILLEFFELELDKFNLSVEDPENHRFTFGDLLEYETRRFVQLYPDKAETYTEDQVRKILREIMPELERYRLLEKIKPDTGERIDQEQTIYEALPAIYHYNTTRLSRSVEMDTIEPEFEGMTDEETDDAD